jgi:hypothetical protein
MIAGGESSGPCGPRLTGGIPCGAKPRVLDSVDRVFSCGKDRVNRLMKLNP